MATPLRILFYFAVSALLVSSCPGSARLASLNYRQARAWRRRMFRRSEYWLTIIGIVSPTGCIALRRVDGGLNFYG
jgi:hypothetical protein